MSYSQMVDLLRKENKNEIVFVKTGAFYIAVEEDAVLMRKTKEETKQDLEKIKKLLKEKLELELNQKTQIFKNKQGVNFCGYKINEYRLKIFVYGKLQNNEIVINKIIKI